MPQPTGLKIFMETSDLPNPILYEKLLIGHTTNSACEMRRPAFTGRKLVPLLDYVLCLFLATAIA